MESVLVLLIVLIIFIIFAIIAVILICRSSKNIKHHSEIHFSGGANIDTGQISSDNNYFKGITVDTDNTYIAANNFKAKENYPQFITIFNLNDLTQTKIEIYEQLFIGRAVGNEIFTIKNDNTVSKIHCKIFKSNGQLYVCDLNSSNHTYLNDTMVQSEVVCKCNDVLKIGKTELRIIF
jgi:pSer/pThr/pTyr-binding forkhead associated (FHA) protein